MAQGVGNFVNVAVILILLVCFNQIKPGNGVGKAGHGYTTSYMQAGKLTTYQYKYRPNALSGTGFPNSCRPCPIKSSEGFESRLCHGQLSD